VIRAAGLILGLAAAIPAEPEFEPWFAERGIAVSRARVGSQPPWIRAVAEVPAPAERVYALVENYGGYPELFAPIVRKATVLETRGAAVRLHLVWPYPFPFRNRDAVVRYEGERRPDGTFLLSWRDDARKGDPAEGVRIARVAGETRIESVSPDRCRVTYVFLGDLGGSFPRAFEEKAWKHEPLGYVLALLRALDLPLPPREEK
jgi:hypothetical protein